MRLFFALWPPPEAARALGEWARAVQRESGGRATRDDAIHLTLAFLGEADAQKAIAAAREVRAAAFELPLDTARYWPRQRIVWAGPGDMPEPLAELALQLNTRLAKEGFALEERPFAAHITLLRKAGKPAALAALPALRWHADEFVLVRSTPSPLGSRYETAARFRLGRK
jgi:2'-5' RNA ligase